MHVHKYVWPIPKKHVYIEKKCSNVCCVGLYWHRARHTRGYVDKLRASICGGIRV